MKFQRRLHVVVVFEVKRVNKLKSVNVELIRGRWRVAMQAEVS